MDSLVFRKAGLGRGSTALVTAMPEVELRLWRPHQGLIPPQQSSVFAAWWALHKIRVFKSGTYGVLLGVHDGEVVHRSCLMPAWYRWPYMADGDVQVSNTWTHPDFRGRGLAVETLRRVIEATHESRTIWYSAHLNNEQSISVGRRAGMTEHAHAVRTKALGLRVLGQFVLDDCTKRPSGDSFSVGQ